MTVLNYQASLSLNETPPSMNTNKVRSNWRGFHTEKKRWQEDLGRLLMAMCLPKPIPSRGPVSVLVTLRFPTRRRRDSENFRPVLSKALGDAMVQGGFLLDDTDQDWRLRVVIGEETGPPRTTVTVSWVEAGEQVA